MLIQIKNRQFNTLGRDRFGDFLKIFENFELISLRPVLEKFTFTRKLYFIFSMLNFRALGSILKNFENFEEGPLNRKLF